MRSAAILLALIFRAAPPSAPAAPAPDTPYVADIRPAAVLLQNVGTAGGVG